MGISTIDRLKYKIEIRNHIKVLRDVLDDFLDTIDDESDSFITELLDKVMSAKMQPIETISKLEKSLINYAHDKVSNGKF